MTVFRLYQNAPFTFENNLILGADPSHVSLSKLVEDELNATQFPFGGFVTLDGRDITGNETEIYLTFDYRRYKDWGNVGEEGAYAGAVVKKTFELLQSCNIIRAMYQIKAGKAGYTDRGDEKTVTVKNYFFNIQSVEIVNAAPEDIEEHKPQTYPAAVWLTATAYRLRVKRNKLLEAYFDGFFDTENAPKLCGGLISAAGRGMLLEKIAGGILAGNAYPIIKPTGGDNSPRIIKSFFNSLSKKYYVFCVGTFTPSADGGSPRTAVYTFITTDETSARAIPEANLGGIVTYTDAATAIFKNDDSGVFIPSDVFVLPIEFLNNAKLNISDETADIKAAKGYYLSKSVVVNSGVYRSALGYSSTDFATITTIGTNKTRVTVNGSLGNETKTADGAPVAGDIERNIFSELRITKNGSLRLSLFVNGSEYDISDDFSVSLTPTNISKSELQAQKISRLSAFVQQGGGVVAGAAAVAAGIATGGAAAVPAVAAGAGAIFSNVSGIAKNIADGAPKQAARQNGTADGVGNATTNGGLYFETFTAENFDTVNAAADSVGYSCSIPAAGVALFEPPQKTYKKPLLLKVEGARISKGKLDEEIKILIETKLNAGALICYGLEALKTAEGV